MSQATIISSTATELLTTPQLVAMYNQLSGKAPIKGFHTRAKGIACVNALRAPATTGTGLQAAKRATAKPSKGLTLKSDQAPAAAVTNAGAGVMGALAATLNGADAEQAAIDALAKARKSSKASKTPSAAADVRYAVDQTALGSIVMPPRLAAFVAKVGVMSSFTKAHAIAATVTTEPSGAEHHMRGNFNWAVRLGLFKPAA